MKTLNKTTMYIPQILHKWDYDLHKYLLKEVPMDWNCKTYSADMEEIINCPHCGCELKIGDSFTSLEFHEQCCGFGYAVCQKCYGEEWLRKKEYKDKENKDI